MSTSTQPEEPATVERFIASEYVKALLARGEDGERDLVSLVERSFRSHAPSALLSVKADFELLRRYTSLSPPQEPGLYLKLLHGRCPSDEEVEDWGEEGPWIGPLNWFHCSYLSTFGLGFAGGEEYCAPPDKSSLPAPMYFAEDMIYYENMFYGDWEVQRCGEK